MNITLETKNTLALTTEAKGKDITWDQATFAFDDAGSQTWDSNGYLILVPESKTTLTLTSETKT